MGLWNNPSGADADIPFFEEGDVQPDRPAILRLSSWMRADFANYWTYSLGQKYDFSRIRAVLVDEPFWTVLGTPDWSNPCRDDRNAALLEYQAQLRNVAGIVRSTSSIPRFWVNFSEPEMRWMMDRDCPALLNEDYIDVVSTDVYFKEFATGPRHYYDWLHANPSKPSQQIALTPGTFFRGSIDTPTQQASLLWGFFDYAAALNHNCKDPERLLSESDYFDDNCPVWIVAGWLGTTDSFNGIVWHGELDPKSTAIRSVWRDELKRRVEAGGHLKSSKRKGRRKPKW